MNQIQQSHLTDSPSNFRRLLTLGPIALAAVIAASCSSSDDDDVASTASEVSSSEDVASTDSEVASNNSAIAEEVVVELARGNTDVIDEYFRQDFVDNVATDSVGAAAFAQAVEDESNAYPEATSEVYRVMGEGNLVFVHSHLVLSPGTLGIAVGDFFRFEGDKIVERWEARQSVPEATVSGNDMFSTLSSPQRLDPDPSVDSSATREVMNAFGFAIGVEKDLTAWDTFVEPPYYQHSTNTDNGAESVREVWGPIIVDPEVVITPVLDLAAGDLYASLNLIDSPDLQFATIDISRVRNDRILEHWDVVHPLN